MFKRQNYRSQSLQRESAHKSSSFVMEENGTQENGFVGIENNEIEKPSTSLSLAPPNCIP